MRLQHYNKIKRAINNPLNNLKHKEALEKMVETYKTIYGDSNLVKLLYINLNNLL